jgi:Tol biopolymer transport system component
VQKSTMQIALLCIFISFSSGVVPASDDGFGGKIAFLRDGEIWLADQDGGNIRRVTDTGGKVEDFLFSPSLIYVAYSKRIKTVEEPGLWEKGEQPPQRSVCTIVVLELRNLKIISEMVPPEGEWIYFDKWMPKDRLLGHRSSGFDVSGFFVFDARGGLQSELDSEQGGRLLDADFTSDSSVQAYAIDSGVGKDYKISLYLVDLNTKAERLLLSKRSVLSPKISPDKTRIAFFEVEYQEKKGSDNLWIYDIQNNHLKKLYHGPAKPKSGGVSDLTWSPDGQNIAVSFPSDTLLLEIENPAHVRRVQGKDLSWVSKQRVIYSREDKVYGYRLDTKKEDPFLENAAKPVFLTSP